MIIGENRVAVIRNIKEYAENHEFHNKVELSDPVLSPAELREITDRYIKNRKKFSFRFKSFFAVKIGRTAARIINKNTDIIGIEKIPKDMEGVLITSNHFSPVENTVIRHLTNKLHRSKLHIISQTTNFAMKGFLGFLMNYANTIPITADDPRYLARDFLGVLKEKLVEKKQAVLLYPEQEMWFNYRKPRPSKKGAYFYAAKLNIPIISCFVEMTDLPEDDTDEFKKVKYTLHVLGVLYPDKNKTAKENTEDLAERDYEMKKACYEKVYNKPLTYEFENTDIAGWKGSL